MTRLSMYIASLALATTPMLLAQAQAPAVPPKATAVILGQVVDGSSGQPIPEATVVLSPGTGGPRRGGDGLAAMALGGADPATAAAFAAAMAARGGGAPSRDQRLLTGSDGRFVFHSLPPGPYQLSVMSGGYAASLGAAPATGNPMLLLAGLARGAAAQPAPAYVLGEGQILTDVRLRLWKFAAVSGTVRDENGEPAVGVTVHAMRRTMIAGRARYAPAGAGRTDDRGVYRIGTLLPGEYLLVQAQTQVAIPAAVLDAVASISMTGAVNKPDPQVMASAAALAQLMMTMPTSGADFGASLATGVRLDGNIVSSGSGAQPETASTGQLLAYQTTFYANASTPVEASLVSLKSGDERAGADFQLRLTPTVRVSGIAIGPVGPAAGLLVRLVVPGDSIVSDTEFDVATAITTADGRFTFYGVPPGEFLVRAESTPMPGMGVGPAALSSPFASPSAFAAMPLPVGTTDITGVSLTLTPTFSVSGRLEFESRTGAQAPAIKGAGVALLPADGRMPNIAMMRPGLVLEDGTFLRADLVPGRYFLTMTPMGGPWQVRSATVNGRDVFDAPLEVRAGDVGNVIITMTDRLAGLSGAVSARAPSKPGDALVVLFPADHRGWIESGMNPRLARTARTSSAGAYTIANLTPGDYAAVAIDRSDEGDLQDPAFVDLLARVATPVTVADEPRTLALTVAAVRR